MWKTIRKPLFQKQNASFAATLALTSRHASRVHHTQHVQHALQIAPPVHACISAKGDKVCQQWEGNSSHHAAGTRHVSVHFDSGRRSLLEPAPSFIYAREQGPRGEVPLHTVLVGETLRINLCPAGRWETGLWSVLDAVSYPRARVSRCASQRSVLCSSGTLRQRCLFCRGKMIGQR